jgi:hypothetical protein
MALNRAPVLYLDETEFQVSMRAQYGWAPLGSTTTKTVPQLHTKNISVSYEFPVKALSITKQEMVLTIEIHTDNTWKDCLRYLQRET